MCDCFNSERRNLVAGLGAYLGLTCAPQLAHAQKTLRFTGSACGLAQDLKLGDVTAYDASAEAKRTVTEICDSVSLPANFAIVAVRDPKVNAYATVRESQRFIVYDEKFMDSVAVRQSKNWSGLAVMAHEIGHHLCGHTLDHIGSRPPRELEADSFAGFAVGALGGKLEDAIRLFEGMSETGSATHPPRRERVAAVTAGWQKASRKRQAGQEQFNLISHNKKADGTYARVVSQFVKEGPSWVEYQHEKRLASFTEGTRDAKAIYLFDASRKMWVRITTDIGARTSEGSWSPGVRGELPSRWSPLDPVAWR